MSDEVWRGMDTVPMDNSRVVVCRRVRDGEKEIGLASFSGSGRIKDWSEYTTKYYGWHPTLPVHLIELKGDNND